MGVEKLSHGGLLKSLDQNPQISPIGATVSQEGTSKTSNEQHIKSAALGREVILGTLTLPIAEFDAVGLVTAARMGGTRTALSRSPRPISRRT